MSKIAKRVAKVQELVQEIKKLVKAHENFEPDYESLPNRQYGDGGYHGAENHYTEASVKDVRAVQAVRDDLGGAVLELKDLLYHWIPSSEKC